MNGEDEAIELYLKIWFKPLEAIVTENYSVAEKFLDEVDASCVYVNASTRFTDGGVLVLVQRSVLAQITSSERGHNGN